MNIRENVTYFIKKNIFIVLVMISLCSVLALSYAKFTINSENYRSNEMYISELLYSIKIDNENTYTIDIEPSETEHTIEITCLNAISSNYKLAYLNNDNLKVKFYLDESFMEEPKIIGVHPNDNTATLWIKADDLINIIKKHGNLVTIVPIK